MTMVASEITRRTPWGRVVFRDGTPVPETMPSGSEWWADERIRLRLRLQKAKAQGRVVTILEPRPIYGRLEGALVFRLRAEPPLWRKGVLIVAAFVGIVAVPAGFLYMLGSAAWEARSTVIAVGVVVLMGWLLLKCLCGHRVVCTGIHCPGCKG